MQSFEFFYGLMLGELLLNHTDNLSKALQSARISAAEGQKVAEMTVRTLQSLRSEETFALFWNKVTKAACDLGVNDPVLPRQRKRPKRHDSGIGEARIPESDTVEDYYRPIFYEALDLIVNGIKERFDQQGYKVYVKLEELLIKAANKKEYEEEFKFIAEFYMGDFDEGLLATQLGVLSSNLPSNSSSYDLVSVLDYLKSLSQAQKALMSEVCKIASLVLVMPASNALSERSFSALRRVKSFLRTTMSQARLNSIMTLHVHKSLTDNLSLLEVANEFVRESRHKQTLFGTLV
jgi:hypothetical protein